MDNVAFLSGEANLVRRANFLSRALSFESEMVPQMRTFLWYQPTKSISVKDVFFF